MKLRLKKLGALALSIVMVFSLFTDFAPLALADEAGPESADASASETTGKPRLYIDFLGDDKTGGLPAPRASAPADRTWAYGSAADNGAVFWVGVGIDKLDAFLLSQGGKGLFSAELGFYYDSTVVEPYTAADMSFAAALTRYNIESGPHNWGSKYQIIAAETGLTPEVDPLTQEAVSGPTTEEMVADGWKMTYISLEKTADVGSQSTNRFAGSAGDQTQYVLLIPFRLKSYDAEQKLCFRLARNASVFTLGGGERGYTDYGAWERDTTRSPVHDLKLMFDFDGDLNIFTGDKVADDKYDARLDIQNGGSAANTASLSVTADPAPRPARVTGDGARLTGLAGGTGVTVDVACRNGFQATVTVETDVDQDPQTVAVTQVTANQKYTFVMPDSHVRVKVEFTPGSEDIPYDATLVERETNPGDLAKTGNQTQLVSDLGQTDLTDPDDRTVPAKAGATVTAKVSCHGDYYAAVTAQGINGDPVALDSNTAGARVETDDATGMTTVTLPGSGTATFTMPATDVTLTVTYIPAHVYQAGLSVAHDPDDPNQLTPADANKAQLSCSGLDDANQPIDRYSSIVNHASNHTPGILTDPAAAQPTDNTDPWLTSRSGRKVTVTMTHDPDYQVRSVVVKAREQPADGPQIADLDITPAVRTGDRLTAVFTMPAYPVDVVVTYEARPTHTLTMVLTGADMTAGDIANAGGTGQGGAAVTTDVVKGQASIAVYEKSQVTLTAAHAAQSSISSITIKDPAGNDYYSGASVTTAADGTRTVKFTMPAADVTVTVHYVQEEEPKYSATLKTTHLAGHAPNPGNTALWTAGTNPVTSYAGVVHTGVVQVQPGYYIDSVTAHSATRAYPVTAAGNGYNNGRGGSVALTFTMPAEDAVITVTFGKGAPPVEPGFSALLKVLDPDNTGEPAADNHASLSVTGSRSDTSGPAAQGTDASLSGLRAGDTVTVELSADAGFYVSQVDVTPAELHVVVWWVDETHAAFILPAGDVGVTVTFLKTPDGGQPAFDLAVDKSEPADQTSVDNTVRKVGSATLNPDYSITALPETVTAAAVAGETVTLDIQAAPGFRVDRVSVLSGGVMVPVTLTADPYSADQTTTATAVFAMPNGAATAVVTYALGEAPQVPGYTAALTVDHPGDPDTGTNWAQMAVTGSRSETGAQVTKGNPATLTGLKAGDTVTLTWHAADGYALDAILVTPAGFAIVPAPAGQDADGNARVRFTVPAGDVAALVRFRQTDAPPTYVANLVLRAPDGIDLAKAGAATFSDGGYSVSVPAGAPVTVDIFANMGFYIESLTVTPADLGVVGTLTGIFAGQTGSFVMPAANCTVNVTFGGGWPDTVAYNAILRVVDPDGDSRNTATLTNTEEGRAESGGPVTGGDLPVLVTGREDDRMEVTFTAAEGYQAVISISDASGKGVAYAWTGEGAVSFRMPASHVSIEARFQRGEPTQHRVTLHVDGNGADYATVDSTFGNTTGSKVRVPDASPEAVDYVYASTGQIVILDGKADAGRYVKTLLVMCGGELIALQSKVMGGYGYETAIFYMPDADVDVYAYFDDGTPPPEVTEYAAALAVTEPGGSAVGAAGQADIQAVAPAALAEGEGTDPAKTTVKSNDRPGYIMVTKEDRIQVAAQAKGDYKVEDIRLTPVGSSLSFSVKFDWIDPETVEFDMPEQPVAVEVLMGRDGSAGFRAQVLINDEAYVGSGPSLNAAILRRDGDPAGSGGGTVTGLALGDGVAVDLTIAPGYLAQVSVYTQTQGGQSILDTPASQQTTASFIMPADDVVVYVKFTRDPAAKYTAVLHVTGAAGTDTDKNKASISSAVGGSAGPVGVGDPDVSIDTPEKGLVTVTAAPLAGYSVKSITVSDAGKADVLYTQTGPGAVTFPMPASAVTVTVEFQEGEADKYKAVLSLDKGGDEANAASIAWGGDTADRDGAFLEVPAGETVSLSATAAAGFYIDAAYVLFGNQMIACTLPGDGRDGRPVTGSFVMPAGGVTVYVVFKPTEEPPQNREYDAVLILTGPEETGSVVSTASMTRSGGADTVTVRTNGHHGYLTAEEGETMTITLSLTPGIQADSITMTYLGVPVTPAATESGYTFVMPASNVCAHIALKDDGAGYTATLMIEDQSTAGAGVSLTATLADDTTKTVSESGKSITDLKGAEPLLTQVTRGEGQADTLVSAVLVTGKAGAAHLTRAPDGGDTWPHTMPRESIVVTAILHDTPADAGDTLYIAAADRAGYGDKAGNILTGLVNETGGGLGGGEGWTAAKAGHTVLLSFATEPGWYASVSARNVDTGGALTVLQMGVTGAGAARIVMPAANVQLTVAYAQTPPAGQVNLTAVLTGHGKESGNAFTLWDTGETPNSMLGLTGDPNDEGDVTGAVANVAPGFPFALETGWAAGFRVRSATLTVGDEASGTVSVDIPLTPQSTAQLASGSFRMPTLPATLTVTYDAGYTATLALADASPGQTAAAAMTNSGDSRSLLVDRTKPTDQLDKLATGTLLTTTPTAGADAVLRGVLLTGGAGTGFLRGEGGAYPYTIADRDVTVTAVFDDAGSASYIAAVRLAGTYADAGNGAAIANKTDSAALSGAIWTMAGAGDKLTVTVSLAEGTQALVTAQTAAGGTEVPVTPGSVAADGSAASFTMTSPAENVLVTVTFVKGHTATLEIVDASGVEGNTVTMGAEMDDGTAQAVTGDGEILVGLAKDQTVTTLPKAQTGAQVSGVICRWSQGAIHVPVGTDPGSFAFTMPDEDVTVTVVLTEAANDSTDPPVPRTYVAAVRLAGDYAVEGNAVSIGNDTTAGLAAGPLWAAAYKKDRMLTRVDTAPGYYARVEAEGVAGPTPLDILQLGVTGEGCRAYLVMPDDNVQVTVTFTAENPFTDQEIVLTGTYDTEKTVAEVKKPEDTAALADSAETPTEVTVIAGDIDTDSGGTEISSDPLTAAPGSALALTTGHAGDHFVKLVTLSVGSVGLTYDLEDDGTAALVMPTAKAGVTVTFAEGTPTPRPHDPAHAPLPDPLPEQYRNLDPALKPGYLEGENHNNGKGFLVTVPALAWEDKAGQTQLTSAWVGPPTPPETAPEAFRVAYTFYTRDPETGTYQKLVSGRDYILMDLVQGRFVEGNTALVGEQFTLEFLTPELQALCGTGGRLFLTAARVDPADGVTVLQPASEKVSLALPARTLWPGPWDPERELDPETRGTIFGENNGGVATVIVPTLLDVDQVRSVPMSDPATKTTFSFRFYHRVTNDQGEEQFTELMWEDPAANDLVVSPADPDQTEGDYTYGVYYTGADDPLTGAAFRLEAADPHSEVGQLLANQGAVRDEEGKYPLYISARTVTRLDDGAEVVKESEPVPLVVPSYYTLSGTLVSYAPTHPATISLYRDGDLSAEPAYVVRTQAREDGSGLWRQDFAFRSSSLVEETGVCSYTLVVEKPGHISYTWPDLVLEAGAAGGRDGHTFTTAGDITLIAGDLNGDGATKINDRSILMGYLGGKEVWSQTRDPSDLTWADSVYNPEARAYGADLNGDGVITVADLSILTAVANYNKTEADNHAPPGLSPVSPATFLYRSASPVLSGAGREEGPVQLPPELEMESPDVAAEDEALAPELPPPEEEGLPTEEEEPEPEEPADGEEPEPEEPEPEEPGGEEPQPPEEGEPEPPDEIPDPPTPESPPAEDSAPPPPPTEDPVPDDDPPPPL